MGEMKRKAAVSVALLAVLGTVVFLLPTAEPEYAKGLQELHCTNDEGRRFVALEWYDAAPKLTKFGNAVVWSIEAPDAFPMIYMQTGGSCIVVTP